MADSNLDVAVRIRTDLQNALQNFNRLEKRLGGAGLAADKARGRMRRLAAAMDGAVRGTSVLSRCSPRERGRTAAGAVGAGCDVPRLVTALGIEDGHRSNLGWWQRWPAHLVDVGAHRLRKRAA